MGATHEHLNDIYEKESEELEPWHDSPGEISKDDWRDFLGKREYATSIPTWSLFIDAGQVSASLCRLLRGPARLKEI